MTDNAAKQTPGRDYGFNAIVSVLILITAWLLLMPVIPAIASATMHRFHLGSDSFPAWAIQFPVPSMYNFANRFVVQSQPELTGASADRTRWRYVNHFPTRTMTFAGARYHFLGQGEDRWFTIETSYRGQAVESRFHVRAKADGGFDLIRLPPNRVAAEASR